MIRPCWCYHQQVITEKISLKLFLELLVAGDNTQQRRAFLFFLRKEKLYIIYFTVYLIKNYAPFLKCQNKPPAKSNNKLKELINDNVLPRLIALLSNLNSIV